MRYGNPPGGKNKKVTRDKIDFSVLRENKRIKPINNSNKCVDVLKCLKCSHTHLQASLIPKFSPG